jgi:dihydrolipoamide dehydrogenase
MDKKSGSVAVKVQPREGEAALIEAEQLLVVVGRAPVTDGIGLEKVGITLEKGFIPVGDYYRTKVPSIFAIGDVVATPQLAHVAFKEGEIVAKHLAGKNPEPRVDLHAIPSAVYCEPQIASFGYKEWQAQQEGIPYKKASFPYRGAGKSVAVEKTDGMVKVLYSPETHEILGASVAGADATELIHEILLAKTSELLPEDIAGMIHAHPTLSEAVMEAMRAVEGWAIHV